MLFSDQFEMFNIKVWLVVSGEKHRTQKQTASIQSALLNKMKKCKNTTQPRLPPTGLETEWPVVGQKTENKP